MSMVKQDTQAIVKRIVDLPTLPQIVTALMNQLEDPKSSVRDVDRILGKDPALVAKLLKLVNSAFYGLSHKVTSIPQGIAILGYNTVKALAISASIFDVFETRGDGFSHQDFWSQSLGTAVIARFTANRHGQGRPPAERLNLDTLFVAGLLHGIGKLVLDQYASEEFAEILEHAKANGLSFAAAEPKVLNTSHAALGYWLLKRWRMAEEVQIAILYQDHVGSTPPAHRRTAAALALSIFWARKRAMGAAGDFDEPALAPDVLSALGVEAADLDAWLPDLDREMEGATPFLALIRE